MYIYNPVGADMVDVAEDTSADRVGTRMQKIRKEHIPRISQGGLGESVGLNANRIAQYESGSRKPKLDMLKSIAKALDVETAALTDPVVATYLGAMYAFFEMERLYGLKLEERWDGRIGLYFKDDIQPQSGADELDRQLHAWLERQKKRDADLQSAKTDEAKDLVYHEYHLWEWNYPKFLDRGLENAELREKLTAELNFINKKLAELDDEAKSE